HRAFNLVHVNRQSKRIRLPPAGERTYNHQAAGAVVTLIGDDQGRAPLGLFASGLGIEIKPDDVAGARHVAAYRGGIPTMKNTAVLLLSSPIPLARKGVV